VHAVVATHVLAPYLGKAQLHRSLRRFYDVFSHFSDLLWLLQLVEGEALLVCASFQHFQLVTHQRCSRSRLFGGRRVLFAQFALVVVLHLIENYVFGLLYIYLISQLLALLVHLLQTLEITLFYRSLSHHLLQLPNFRL
jgi:hypothetical protein